MESHKKNNQEDNSFFEQIDNYLLEKLNQAESQRFEQELAKNDLLREEVGFRRLLIKGIHLQENNRLKQELKKSGERLSTLGQKNKLWIRIAFSSAAALVLLFSYLQLIQNENNAKSQVKQNFIAAYASLPSNHLSPRTRSVEKQTVITTAMEYYDNRQFEMLHRLLAPLAENGELNENESFYYSLSLMMDDRLIQALEGFSGMNNSEFYFSDYVSFYRALIYLELEQTEKGNNLLDSIAASGGKFHDLSKQILKEIR